jgi:hypothetical protein
MEGERTNLADEETATNEEGEEVGGAEEVIDEGDGRWVETAEGSVSPNAWERRERSGGNE